MCSLGTSEVFVAKNSFFVSSLLVHGCELPMAISCRSKKKKGVRSPAVRPSADKQRTHISSQSELRVYLKRNRRKEYKKKRKKKK